MKTGRISVFTAALLAMVFITGGMAEAKKPITLKFAGINPVEHSSTVEMKKMAKNIEKETNGEVKVRVFPAGQLGDYTLVYEEITKGTIDMALIPIPTEYEPKHQITLVPCLAKDYNDVKKIFAKNGWLYNTVDKLHKNLDVVFLGFQIEGFGGIGSVNKITDPMNPKTPKNMLCRISTMELDKFVLDALNYATVTVPYSDLYTALQTGVVEGWYGGAAVHSYQGYRDVLKNYYNFNLFVEAYQLVVSKKSWNKLTPEQQAVIAKDADILCKNSITIAEKEENEYLKKMKEAGMNVYVYTAEELTPINERVKKVVWPKLDKLLGKELTNDLMKQFAADK